MSQDYKFKFDQMRESQPGEPNDAEDNLLYNTAGHIRNVAFVQTNGAKRSFNYSYLVSHEYNPNTSTIILEFTTHTVLIKGYNLEQLYFELFDQRNRIVNCIDPRYVALEATQSVVTEISIKKNS